MSYPPKPEALKAIAGTQRRDRAATGGVQLPTVATLPDAPDWLPNAHAADEWRRLGALLLANKLLTDGGLSALAMLCAMHGKAVQAYAAGQQPPAAMLRQLRALSNDFGLSPAAHGRVRPGAPAKAGNPFAANGRRPGAGGAAPW